MYPHVVVLLPGITGSVLKKDGKVIWGITASSVLDFLFSQGENLQALALDHDTPTSPVLEDGVSVDSVFHDVHLIPGLWKIEGYSGIRETLLRYLGLSRANLRS